MWIMCTNALENWKSINLKNLKFQTRYGSSIKYSWLIYLHDHRSNYIFSLNSPYIYVQFCIAFNNVAHVQRMLTSTLDKLCIEQILSKLSIELSPNSTALEQCRSTPPNLISNLAEKVQRKMQESLVLSCAKVVQLTN